MTTQSEALKALDTALWRARAEATPTSILHIQVGHAIDALGQLKTALAQPEQEPVVCDCTNPWAHDQCTEEKGCKIKKKLLRTPPQRTWEGQIDNDAFFKSVESQLEQEPVAHCTVRPLRGDESYPKTEIIWVKGRPVAGPLYTTPPQRTWVGLTEEDLKLLSAEWRIVYGAWMDDFARDIEDKLRSKNENSMG